MTSVNSLPVSHSFALPLDAATRRMAILAQSGAGKSNLAVVLAERMFHAGIPWVAIDPKGDWWGIRSAALGKGLPVPIFGGLHGDLPLEATSGKLLAETIADTRLTCVLDVSEFNTQQDMYRFLADFGETLLQKNRDVLHLFLEEADEYLPQVAKLKGNLPRCLGVWQRVVKRGRFRGIGSTQITQRSASLNKDTLYQAEALFALRVTGPGDLEAVKGWVKYHAVADKVVASLPTLADGAGWLLSPSWLKRIEQTTFYRRQTFDSGATPVLKNSAKTMATLADVDLGLLKSRMAESIERAKQDDPAYLRQRIVQLESKLVQAEQAPAAPVVTTPVLTDEDRDLLRGLESRLSRLQGGDIKVDTRVLEEAATQTFNQLFAGMRAELLTALTSARLGDTVERLRSFYTRTTISDRPRQEVRAHAPAQREWTAEVTQPVGNGQPHPEIGKSGLQRMLVALAQRPNGLTRGQLGVRARVSSKGGSFDTYLSRARKHGWIRTEGDRIHLTAEGRKALGTYTPLPTGRALANHYIQEFGTSGAARMLQVLVDAYPADITREELGRRANVSPEGGSFDTYVSRLKTLELVTRRGTGLRASEELFT